MPTPIDRKVVIIIPNLNGREHLECCLPSVLAQTCQGFELILVDNGSTDGSVEFVQNNFPGIHIIKNERNLGFAEANNLAIRATTAPYIVTLNNDTRVDPEWLTEMVKAAESDPAAGMVACKILYMQPPQLIDSAGMDLDRTGMGWSRYNGLNDKNDETVPYEVFCPCAAAALYKREMLDQVGLFDESFFAYYEDLDLGWRARLMGWKCLYAPAAIVYHSHSATSRQGSGFKRYMLSRNRIWSVLKNYPTPELWLRLPELLFYDLVAAVYRVGLEKSLAPIQGRLAVLSGLRRIWRQRRLIQQKRTLSARQLDQLTLPPVNFITSYQSRARQHQEK